MSPPPQPSVNKLTPTSILGRGIEKRKIRILTPSLHENISPSTLMNVFIYPLFYKRFPLFSIWNTHTDCVWRKPQGPAVIGPPWSKEVPRILAFGILISAEFPHATSSMAKSWVHASQNSCRGVSYDQDQQGAGQMENPVWWLDLRYFSNHPNFPMPWWKCCPL